MPTYTCPNGCKITTDDPPICHKCDLVATAYNATAGTASDWMKRCDYDDACRNLQDQMDDAFDNQYFSDY